MHELARDAIRKLDQYGPARNRAVDRYPRFVEVSDDEALALLAYIRDLEATATNVRSFLAES